MIVHQRRPVRSLHELSVEAQSVRTAVEVHPAESGAARIALNRRLARPDVITRNFYRELTRR